MSTRLKILIGAARGLAFLHTSDKQVIYRDFGASNILLDSVSEILQEIMHTIVAGNCWILGQVNIFFMPFIVELSCEVKSGNMKSK